MAAYRKHRRQMFWQILFPVLLLTVVVIAVTVYLIVITANPASQVDTQWANISVIWLALPTILTCLIFMALTGGLVFLMAKLLGKMPGWMAVAQYYAARMAQMAESVGNKAAAPVIKTRGMLAGW